MHSVDTIAAIPAVNAEDVPTDTTPTEVQPRLSEAAAEAWIPRTCFKNGPPELIGVELELLVADNLRPDGLSNHFPQHRYPELIAQLARGGLDGLLTIEPGGQVELSSRPGPTLCTTISTVRHDLAALRRRAGRCGADLVGLGVDPIRAPQRTATEPRYAAMEHYLDRWGQHGRIMMCSTASVQVNVEAGIAAEAIRRTGPPPVASFQERWDLLHAAGPALVAAFANSGWRGGRQTGWKSSRQAVWLNLDPTRTGIPPAGAAECLEDGFTRWALDAPLMLVRREQGPWTAPAGVSFRTWLRHGRQVIPDRPAPTTDDLAYHLTTLFPQVRPRGHYEIRFIDAQPGDWWTVPTAVIAALLGNRDAADRAREICAPTEGRWLAAAKAGVTDPELFRAANGVLQTAAEALRVNPDTVEFAELVESYLQRWTARGRCPADDPPTSATGSNDTQTPLTIGDLPRDQTA